MPAEETLLKSILSARGIVDPAAITEFLAPDYDLHTHAPEMLADMDRATARILEALARAERIAIYADFDCDGIPGAALLSDLFRKLQYDNVEVYLPHRDREGYGVHREALAELKGRGVSLLITVDVGTTASDAIHYANELGLDVIVTDHHEIVGDLPPALAIINPKRAPYPFPHLCGAGVAFKLAQALLHAGKRAGDVRFTAIPDGWEKWLLDLVAIATVADMVPLIGENRALTYWGLAVLRKSARPGIGALCTKLRLRMHELSEDDIGFSIAPRVNAASRMDSPDLALKLLTTTDRTEAELLTAKLEALNASRKGVVASMVKDARHRAHERFPLEHPVIVLGDPAWKPALLGLACNTLVEERGGIVCLWGRDARGRIKGSCRSDGTRSVVELFQAAAEQFEEFGGHVASGGFSLKDGAVHTLPDALAERAAALPRLAPTTAARFDLDLHLSHLGAVHRALSKLAPFGIGNPKPIVRTRALLGAPRRFGKEQNHVEIPLTCTYSGASARAYDFFRSAEDFTRPPVLGEIADVLATVERDSFRGGYALRLVDIVAQTAA